MTDNARQIITLPEGPTVDMAEWLTEVHASAVCTYRHGCPCEFCSKARAVVEALETDFAGTVFHTVGGKS